MSFWADEPPKGNVVVGALVDYRVNYTKDSGHTLHTALLIG